MERGLLGQSLLMEVGEEEMKGGGREVMEERCNVYMNIFMKGVFSTLLRLPANRVGLHLPCHNQKVFHRLPT